MPKNLNRKDRLLIAGFILLACFVSGGMVMAEAFAPKPGQKPLVQFVEIVGTENIPVVPIPVVKPELIVETKSREPKKRMSFGGKLFSEKQSRLYREIFELQNKGDMQAADVKIKKLKNDVLMGHVLAERYLHPTSYRATFSELNNWMSRYSDHPQAEKIYKLAVSRRPKDGEGVESPQKQNNISGNLGAVSKRGQLYRSTKSRNESQNQKVNTFKKDIRRQLKRNQPTMAMNILSTDYTVKFLDSVEYDRLRAEVAAGYLFVDKLDQALKLSTESLNRSGKKVPLAGWVKGLVQWQRQAYSSAAKAFSSSASSSYSSGWMVSAAGYWASRAHMRAGNVSQVSKWLDLASTYPRTFYGLIATRALGHKTEFDWGVPELTRDHLKNIEHSEHGRRATFLIKSGQVSLAESELRNIEIKTDEQKESLLAYAHHFKLPSLSMQLGNAVKNKKGGLYDAALYPDTSWSPQSGYKIDRALIHAIVRQESRFKTNARNPSGATGLMQLMPNTANHVSGKDIYHQASGQYQLKDPSVNLELGQTYIDELLNHRAVGKDLLSLAIAYNAGPGNLSKWKRERAHIKDPLLFIETIPYHETRAFVERVLSNYWIYRMRFNQDTPSLDAVAEGKWARYAAQDVSGQKIAAAR